MYLNVGQFFSSAGHVVKNFAERFAYAPSRMQKVLFANGIALPEKITLLSGHSIGSVFMTSNYTSLYRSFNDLGRSVLAHYSLPSMDWIRALFSSKEMTVGYHTFGSVTGVNVLIGLTKVIHAFSRLKICNVLGDRRGALMNRLGIAEGISVGGAGVSFATFRVLSVVDALRQSRANSLLGRISSGFVMAGLACYAAFFSVLSTILGIQLYEGYQLKKKLQAAGDLASQIEVLERKLHADGGKIFAKLIKNLGSVEAAKEVLIQEALSYGKANLKQLLEKLQIKNMSESELEEIIHKTIESGVWGLTDASIQNQVKEKFVQLGLSARVQKTELKQQAKMQRILSSAGFAALVELKPARNLANRIRLGDKAAVEKGQGLVDRIKQGGQSKTTETAVCLSVLLFGMVAMVLAIVFTGGMGLILSSAVMLIFGIMMTGVDGYYLLQSYREELPAVYDKKMLILSSLMGLSSLAIMVTLAVTGVVSMGTVPLVIAIVLTALWLSQNGVTWAVMNRNQRRHAAIQKVEEAKEARLDLLRQDLAVLSGRQYTWESEASA